MQLVDGLDFRWIEALASSRPCLAELAPELQNDASKMSTRPPPYARVRITGESLDPLAVTQALRLPPDRTHRKGEPQLQRRRDGSIEERPPYRDGMWSMSSAGWVDSGELDAHLRWLLAQLEPRAAQLRGLQEAGAAVEMVCCGEQGPYEVPLPAQTLGRCAALAAPVVLEQPQSPDGEAELDRAETAELNRAELNRAE